MLILPKFIYKFNKILTKIPAGFCYCSITEIDKPILKCIWKFKEPGVTNLEQQQK